ncbi:MAG: hypothetical protein QOH21_3626 [Acidobacteriota bacterium]|jgi:hypothetical protein|nr:hypothetical protein [Acidobacteriota bacterium]
MDRRAIWFYCIAMANRVATIDIPDQAAEIKARAAAAGLGVREYIGRIADASPGGQLTNVQLFAVLTAIPPLDVTLDSADIIRELRGPLPDVDDDHH